MYSSISCGAALDTVQGAPVPGFCSNGALGLAEIETDAVSPINHQVHTCSK